MSATQVVPHITTTSPWVLVAVATPSVLIGCWAFRDSFRPPRSPLVVRLCIGMSLLALVQWVTFVVLRITGTWSPQTYETMAAPLRLLAFSPFGGWGIWFTTRWFWRQSIRKRTVCGVSVARSGRRLGE